MSWRAATFHSLWRSNLPKAHTCSDPSTTSSELTCQASGTVSSARARHSGSTSPPVTRHTVSSQLELTWMAPSCQHTSCGSRMASRRR